MDKYIPVSIQGYDLGKMNPEIIKMGAKSRDFKSRDEMLLFFLNMSLKEKATGDIQQDVKTLFKLASYYGYRDAADYISSEIVHFARPKNDVCRTCQWCNRQFCAMELCRINPLERGCRYWKPIEEKNDKVISIYDNNRELRKISKEALSEVESKKTIDLYPVITEDEVTFEEDYQYPFEVSKLHRANIINHLNEFADITRYIYNIWDTYYVKSSEKAASEIESSNNEFILYANSLFSELFTTEEISSYKEYDNKEPDIEDSFIYAINCMFNRITAKEHPENMFDIIISFTDLRTVNVAVNKMLGLKSTKDDFVNIKDPENNEMQELYGQITDILPPEIIKTLNMIDDITAEPIEKNTSETNDFDFLKDKDFPDISTFSATEAELQSNIDRFINISQYLLSLWLVFKSHNKFTLKLTLNKNDGPVKRYINEEMNHWIDTGCLPKSKNIGTPQNIEELFTDYANVVMEYITKDAPLHIFEEVIIKYSDAKNARGTINRILSEE